MNQPIKVLIIEDNEDDALLILRSLRQGDLDVSSQRVETADALVEALNNGDWDVIISDYSLPHFDAPRALAVVQQRQIDIPFIVVSGTIGESSAVELMKQGANDYLIKGKLARLSEAVRREVRESQIRRERKQSAIELAQTKERLQLALEGSAIGLWDWTVPTGGLTINDRWAEMLGYTVEELAPISAKTWEQLAHPEDVQEATKLLQKHFRHEIPIYEFELRMRHKSRGWFWVLSKGKVTAWDAQDNALRVTGTHLDINDRKRAELRLSLQSAILERISKAEPLSEILSALVTTIEAIMNNGICALFLCGPDGKLYYEFSASLPDSYGRKLGGIEIAEGSGCCGTAAFRQELVIVDDITTDPLWQNYQKLALAHNLRSCWSIPAIASDGEVLGAFTIYHQDIRQPSAEEVEIINLAVDITKIAIERNQSVRALEQINRNLEIRVAQRTEALRQSEERARATLMALPDLVFRVNEAGEYLDFLASPNVGNIVDPDQVIGKRLADYLPPEIWEKERLAMDQAITAQTLQTYEQEILINGQLRHEEVRVAPCGNNEAVFFVRDISDRKQAEILLTQQNNQESLLREITQRIRQSLDLQTIFKTSVEEVRQFLQADRVGIFKFYPESNFDDGEIVSESVVDGYPSAIAIRVHDHTFGENYANLYSKGRYYVVDDIYNNGDQKCHVDILALFQVRANIVMPLLCGDDLWGLLCIHQCGSTRHWLQTEIDFSQKITNQLAIAIQQASLFDQLQRELAERQQTEAKLTESNQKLAISNQELVRATRLKDEFLANMSHELRTPLNAILGMTEAVLDEVFGSINDQQRKSLQTVERSGSHLLELINDILDVAKIESGQIELDCTSISVSHLCQSSLAFIKQQALKKRIQLEISQLPTNLPDLFADERRIRQVLINLLNNAVKFTPEGGRITLEVSQISQSLTTSLDSPDQYSQKFLRIAVIDTGIGISAENIPKLFQPFIQIDSALNRQYTGTGLGLSLVKRLVELHGGNVELTSELGVGSCFAIELPALAMCHTQEAITISSDPEPMHTKIKDAPLVLLAEDNEANILTISSYLEAKGYRIVLAKDGLEAIAAAKLHHPDLILMDVQMPKMDGLEAIKNIRSEPQFTKIPIIALTALAMTGDREKCIKAGANDYLAKPIRLRTLSQLIQAFLSS